MKIIARSFLAAITLLIILAVVVLAWQTPLTGKVTKDGHPVAGALVVADCDGVITTTLSQDDGFYSVVVDEGGECVLHATKDGWASSYVDVLSAGWDPEGTELELFWFFPDTFVK